MIRNITELTPEERFVLAIHSRRRRPDAKQREEMEALKQAIRNRENLQ